MLSHFTRINIKGGLPVVEAFAWHEKLLARRDRDYDPRIRTRIECGRDMTAIEYISTWSRLAPTLSAALMPRPRGSMQGSSQPWQ